MNAKRQLFWVLVVTTVASGIVYLLYLAPGWLFRIEILASKWTDHLLGLPPTDPGTIDFWNIVCIVVAAVIIYYAWATTSAIFNGDLRLDMWPPRFTEDKKPEERTC